MYLEIYDVTTQDDVQCNSSYVIVYGIFEDAIYHCEQSKYKKYKIRELVWSPSENFIPKVFDGFYCKDHYEKLTKDYKKSAGKIGKVIDITEDIAKGDVKKIIDFLSKFLSEGYDRLYWDGYDSSIYVYNSRHTE